MAACSLFFEQCLKQLLLEPRKWAGCMLSYFASTGAAGAVLLLIWALGRFLGVSFFWTACVCSYVLIGMQAGTFSFASTPHPARGEFIVSFTIGAPLAIAFVIVASIYLLGGIEPPAPGRSATTSTAAGSPRISACMYMA